MDKLNWMKKACALLLLCATTGVALPAQTFTTLHSFDNSDGSYLLAGLVQGTDGNFYGTTTGGGIYGDGTVFSITAGGTLTTLHSFDGTDGSIPTAGLIQGTDGKLYGTTSSGGAGNVGTIFSITESGTLTTLHSFDDTDGSGVFGGLVQATNGKFYGTTYAGGTNDRGTVFSITPSGTLTTLHNFHGPDGRYSQAGLVQGIDGKFYGTTSGGGANDTCEYGCGTVFSISASGTLATLHSFGADGYYPQAALVQDTDGTFYGTTPAGGDNYCGGGCGTVFRITPGGTLTTLHSFEDTDGAYPMAGLVRGIDGKFYGTTLGGGDYCASGGCGTAFNITSGGELTTLHKFYGPDGERPAGGIAQGTDGTFYGTTFEGGANSCPAGNCGTVFNLSVGLGPFVETLPTSGAVGVAVTILGTGLTGSTKVTFHGIAATFTVVSASEITTSVPTGATTGTVKVITPGGTLSSNQAFTVLP